MFVLWFLPFNGEHMRIFSLLFHATKYILVLYCLLDRKSYFITASCALGNYVWHFLQLYDT